MSTRTSVACPPNGCGHSRWPGVRMETHGSWWLCCLGHAGLLSAPLGPCGTSKGKTASLLPPPAAKKGQATQEGGPERPSVEQTKALETGSWASMGTGRRLSEKCGSTWLISRSWILLCLSFPKYKMNLNKTSRHDSR